MFLSRLESRRTQQVSRKWTRLRLISLITRIGTQLHHVLHHQPQNSFLILSRMKHVFVTWNSRHPHYTIWSTSHDDNVSNLHQFHNFINRTNVNINWWRVCTVLMCANIFSFRNPQNVGIFMDTHQTPAWNETKNVVRGQKEFCRRTGKRKSFLACAKLLGFDCVRDSFWGCTMKIFHIRKHNVSAQ